MKKILLFICLFISQSAYSEVTFINTNPENNLEIDYKICQERFLEKPRVCGELSTIKINYGKNNIIKINPNGNNYNLILIVAARESDQYGNIISKSGFGYEKSDQGESSYCSSYFTRGERNFNIGINFDNKKSSPVIFCEAQYY